ncbi:MAG: hypothetical protein EOL95_07275 [Bacteroidia bacterium]|nr:hypothetical protein [Bacteroidia bacterium]
MTQIVTYKSMFKYQLANAAGVDVRTLNRWLKTDKEEINKLMGTISTRLLPPSVVEYICTKYVIEL